jgi:hypothetical protein
MVKGSLTRDFRLQILHESVPPGRWESLNNFRPPLWLIFTALTADFQLELIYLQKDAEGVRRDLLKMLAPVSILLLFFSPLASFAYIIQVRESFKGIVLRE